MCIRDSANQGKSLRRLSYDNVVGSQETVEWKEKLTKGGDRHFYVFEKRRIKKKTVLNGTIFIKNCMTFLLNLKNVTVT